MNRIWRPWLLLMESKRITGREGCTARPPRASGAPAATPALGRSARAGYSSTRPTAYTSRSRLRSRRLASEPIPDLNRAASGADEPQRFAAFRSLRHRNFRLLWIGTLISNSGDWMDQIAL